MSDELALIRVSTLEGIADAVREKRGLTEKIKVDQIEAEARSIQTGGGSSEEDFLRKLAGPQDATNNGYEIKAEDLYGLEEICSNAFYGKQGLTKVTIPTTVKKIDNYAFYGCENVVLGNEIIPDNVESIGSYAFYGCKKIKKVKFNSTNKLTSIGSGAFYNNTALNEVFIPAAIKEIPYTAFYGCENLYTLTLSEGVEEIGQNAFYGCNNLSVTLPSTITYIGNSAFYAGMASSKRSTARFNGTLSQWCNVDLYGDASHPLYGNRNSFAQFYVNGELLKDVVIPDDVVEIKKYVFSDCYNITSVVINNNVERIETSAFERCTNMTSATIGSGVQYIGSYAFYQCNQLNDIYYAGTEEQWNAISKSSSSIPTHTTIHFVGSGGGDIEEDDRGSVGLEYEEGLNSTYTVSGIGTFDGENLVIPNKHEGKMVVAIKDSAFSGCSNLTSVEFLDNIERIGYGAFGYCSNIETVTFSEKCNLTYIGGSAFSGCSKLTSIKIPSSTTEIGDYAFSCCYSLTTADLPEGLTSLGSSAFSFCGLERIVIPEKIVYIKDSTFYGCSKLTSIIIHKNINRIGSEAFKDCYALAEVYNYSSLNITKGSEYNGMVAYYALDVYTTNEPSKLTTDENGFVTYTSGNEKVIILYKGNSLEISIPDGTTKITASSFSGCGLTKLVVPDSVETIGERAFSGCDSLTNITIGSGVRSIGSYAFYNMAMWLSCEFKGTAPPSLGSDIFSVEPLDISVTVPAGCKDTYLAAEGWSSLPTNVTIYEATT